MTPTKKYGYHVSPDAEKIITNGHRVGSKPRVIQKEIKSKLNERVLVKVISGKLSALDLRKEKILWLKRKGATIVREFLEKAKGDADTSVLQAVLANAVYHDLLIRYAGEEGILEEIPIKDLLKITSDYEKLRLSALRSEKGSKEKNGMNAGQAIELLDVFEKELNGNKELKKAFLEKKSGLTEKLKEIFSDEEFETAMVDYEALQKLKEKYERTRHDGANG